MSKKYLVLFIPLIALFVVGMISGDVYSLGHFKDQGGPGGTVADCDICHDFAGGYYASPPTGYNLRWVKTTINSRTVKFVKFSSSDPPNIGVADGTLADGNDSLLDGACEVCHTQTNYHTNTGDGKNHFDGVNCTVCHPHFVDDINNYFEPRFVGNQSHITHFDDPKGPMFKVIRPSDFCTYYCHSTSDFSLFKDGQPKATTTVCNPCHSKGGAFDGVNDPAIGAKTNWGEDVDGDGVYRRSLPSDPWPNVLKAGKENWCAGCHDAGNSVVQGVSAPDVMGDNVNYGYNVSGHGRNPQNYIRCDDCHDAVAVHTDGNARTYSASASPRNYQSGYRLLFGMDIPRTDFAWGQNAFDLCMQCHSYGDLTGLTTSNFREDRNSPAERNLHNYHIGEIYRGMIVWDSDWNATAANCATGACADSAMSCTACHNVHGSPCLQGGDTEVACPDPPHVPMIRHGELMSSPGLDKTPALRFNWYDSNNVATTDFTESRWGGLLCGQPQDVTYNWVCWGCHTRGEVKYYRTPGGPEGVTVNSVYTTDLSNTPKTTFAPGAQIRYHVSYTVSGPLAAYTMKGLGTSKNTSGTPAWTQTLETLTATRAAGTYEFTWDRTLTSATSGQNAKVTITVKQKNGAVLINEASGFAIFRIQ